MHDRVEKTIGHRQMLSIALPVMLSNLSVPLLGLVDTAAVGQLNDAYHIGAVAIGALIFDFIFWGFGFLRMGTSGFAAQAEGRGDDQDLRDTLGRALFIAAVSSAALIVLQPLIGSLAFFLIEGSPEVEKNARLYFDIRIWSAPAALANYAFYGFLIGIGRARAVLAFVLLLNGTNIVLDAFFVLVMGMGADGVALGTLIAEFTGATAAAILIWRELATRGGIWNWQRIRETRAVRRMMDVNIDILIRSLCLVFAFSWFTWQSAGAGDLILAANAVLINMFAVAVSLLDGFSFAAEAHVGQAVGAGSRSRFWQAVRMSGLWAGGLATIATLATFVFGSNVIDMLTVNPEVRLVAREYLPWIAIAPVAGFSCFLLDGIFVGATQTRDMRNMMLVTVVLYLIAWWFLVPAFDNHGRWMAIIVLLILRALTLGTRMPALERRAFG
jgi:MATE family multidrug resistance protein